jgi:hypothetical protein
MDEDEDDEEEEEDDKYKRIVSFSIIQFIDII